MLASATSTTATSSPRKKGSKSHRGAGAFSPVDTLDSAREPFFSLKVPATDPETVGVLGCDQRSPAADNISTGVDGYEKSAIVPMVNQREPPRIQSSPKKQQQQQPTMAGFTSVNSDTQPHDQTAQNTGLSNPPQSSVPQANIRPKAEARDRPLNDGKNAPELGKSDQSRSNARTELTDADLKAMRDRVFTSNPQRRHGSGTHGSQSRDGRPFSNVQPPTQSTATGHPSQPVPRVPYENAPSTSSSFNPNMGEHFGQRPFSNVPESSLNAHSSFNAYQYPKPQFQYHNSFQQVSPSLVPPALQNIPPAGQNSHEAARQANLAPRPSQAPPRPFQTHPAQPMYSASGFTSANAFKGPAHHNFVDLTVPATKDPDDHFDPDKVLGINQFGSYDPSTYVDPAQASQNIKDLLEGVFEEDEEDKPKTRLRKRKEKKAAKDTATEKLSEKMQGLEVKSEDVAKDQKDPPEEHGEEEDDGSVEGLSVKLLPHQIDGVTWMLDKEVGERKRNGVLPRGGILADDVSLRYIKVSNTRV